MKILMVLTSHNRLGNTEKSTGFWLEEFAAPYYVFKDAGVEITIASPVGGAPPLDPKSDDDASQTDATRRYKNDASALQLLSHSERLRDMEASNFDALFFPGGHGPLWDLSENLDAISLIEEMLASGKPVAAVCHAPAIFRHTKRADGSYVVEGKNVTAFANTEEQASGLIDVVPFLVEEMLKANGATYSKTKDWQPFVVTDGLLITGQNPASSKAAAQALVACVDASLPLAVST